MLTIRGNKQSILILSPGIEVPEVTITLNKTEERAQLARFGRRARNSYRQHAIGPS
jgi:hypothetical protein